MRRLFVWSALLAGTSVASAQWLQYTNETDARWHVVNEQQGGDYDVSEKNGAYGDLDQDGDLDIVMVRMRAWGATNTPTNGQRTVLLMMNENGEFHDRTALYASTADIPGDMGMLQPVINRDVVITDVNLDGWLDVVTSTSFSHSFTKPISHPRVYINLGEDGSGNWLGLRFENSRFPQLMVGATPIAPRFCAISAGDIDDDGDPDLWFSDYDNSGNGELPNQPAGHDIGNTLMINMGGLQGGTVGTFQNQTNPRVPAGMAAIGVDFGTDSDIVDINGDGNLDLTVVSTLGSGPRRVEVGYNNPFNLGFVSTTNNAVSGQAPYKSTWGDVNNDGRADAIISDDGTDYYVLNNSTTGSPPNQVATWSQHNLPGATGGFGGDSTLADLDLDGDLDAIITQVDVDISGCTNGGGSDILRNNKIEGAANNNLFSAGNSQVTVNGVANPNLTGYNSGHDVLVLDVNGDEWPDIVWFNGCSTSHTPGSGAQRAIQVWIGVDPNPDPPCPGDADGDGDVDLGDLGVVLANFNAGDGGDLDGDGDTDLGDLGIVLANFGVPCP